MLILLREQLIMMLLQADMEIKIMDFHILLLIIYTMEMQELLQIILTYPTHGLILKFQVLPLIVHVKHANFTDNAAKYYIYLSQNAGVKVGTINQDRAASGWSTIQRANIAVPNVTFYSSESAEVVPSGGKGNNTGADAIKVTITS